jgi:hypothetical protein
MSTDSSSSPGTAIPAQRFQRAQLQPFAEHPLGALAAKTIKNILRTAGFGTPELENA